MTIIVALGIAAAAPFVDESAPIKSRTEASNIDLLIAAVRRNGGPDLDVVEDAIGTPLRQVDANPSFTIHQGSNRDGTTVEVRVPVPDGPATAGAIAIVRPVRCILEKVLRHRYGSWEPTSVPRGHSSDEETGWTRTEDWGTITFGFAERSPSCLSSIAFTRL